MKKLICALGLSLLTALPATADSTDLRVLIDVSGSMKANDPNSLRGPAAELIARLLPAKSRAGAWLFGTQTRSLVDYGDVDLAWRDQTVQSSANIPSRDLFTDIEGALKVGLSKPSTQDKACHLILVTDGLIDLKAGAAAIRDSRARIESQWISKAKTMGCRVHTLGLSDQADLALLNRIAQGTGGLSAKLTGSAELIPVILDALELALPGNRLPLAEQNFQVDESVIRQTIISLGNYDVPLELLAPDGTVITPDNLPAGVEYQEADGFQLYQITNPDAGEWKAANDVPINRVLADSEIEMLLESWPSTIESGQPLNAVVTFNRNKSPLDPSIQIELSGRMESDADQIPLSFEQQNNRYSAPVELTEPGTYQLEILAKGDDFARGLSRMIQVIEPQVPIALESGTTQKIQSFEAPASLPEIEPKETRPAPAIDTSIQTNDGLTLTQWFWMIAAGLLVLIVGLAFWLARAEKKA